MTQFVLTQGDYAHYRGYLFAFNKPTTVADPATVAALRKQPAKFKEIADAEEIKEAPAAEILNDKDACPKCGRIVRQGKYMHVKFCRGAK